MSGETIYPVGAEIIICPICRTGYKPGDRHGCAAPESERAIRDAEHYTSTDRIVPRYDSINPSHYRAASGLESFDVIEAFFPDKPYRWAPFKYLVRAGKKPGQDEVQDLQKAIWWINREIAWIRSEREQTDARNYERNGRPGRRADHEPLRPLYPEGDARNS